VKFELTSNGLGDRRVQTKKSTSLLLIFSLDPYFGFGKKLIQKVKPPTVVELLKYSITQHHEI